MATIAELEVDDAHAFECGQRLCSREHLAENGARR
jgi:hypothetical protein